MPSDAQKHLERAARHVDAGAWQEAVEAYDALLASEPDQLDALVGKAEILVVGWELPERVPESRTEAANYRTWQFVEALRADGHEICLAAGRISGDYPAEPLAVLTRGRDVYVPLRFSHPGWMGLLQRIHDSYRPDCIVGITFLGSLRATRIRTKAPLWLDIYGDQLAEMQHELDKLITSGVEVSPELAKEYTRIVINPEISKDAAPTALQEVEEGTGSTVKFTATLDGKPVEVFEQINVLPKVYKVVVTADGYFPGERTWTATQGSTSIVDVPLTPKPAKVTLDTESGARVSVDGRPIGAASNTPIELPAGRHVITLSMRGRIPVAREVVRMELLVPSASKTTCPYKGQASYWDAVVGGVVVEDAAWCYEHPHPEAVAVRGRPLEQRVDERRGGGAAQEDDRSQHEQHEQDGNEPPLLVLHDHRPHLADESGLRLLRLPLELVGAAAGGVACRASRFWNATSPTCRRG